jgi:hypothetical protein
MRKVGKRMSPEDRAKKPFVDTLSDVNKMIRTDYGGKDAVEMAMKKACESYLGQGVELSPSALKIVAEFAVIHAADQVAGCRKRIKPIVEDCKRRARIMESNIVPGHTPEIIIAAVNGGEALQKVNF